jgi:hypothetical protein
MHLSGPSDFGKCESESGYTKWTSRVLTEKKSYHVLVEGTSYAGRYIKLPSFPSGKRHHFHINIDCIHLIKLLLKMAPIILNILSLASLLAVATAGPLASNPLKRDANIGEVIPGPGRPSLASLGLTSDDLRDPDFLGNFLLLSISIQLYQTTPPPPPPTN